jgi:hypothetical protein
VSGRELRLVFLGVVLLCCIIVLYSVRTYFAPMSESPMTAAQFVNEYQQVRTAEAIDDPLARCLA